MLRSWPTTWRWSSAVLLLFFGGAGCRLMTTEDVKRYATVAADPTRDTQAAAIYHERALKIIERASKSCPCECDCLLGCLKDLGKAEALCQKALLADVRYGPAHNTLGMLYYHQEKLYLAAWEFEYASRLMPSHAEPLNNLGLAYEAAGKMGVAIGYYETAVEMVPTNPVYLGNLAKAQLRAGADVEAVRGVLQEMIFYDDRPEWVAWARDTVGIHPIKLASAEFDGTPEGARNETDQEILPPPSEPTPVVDPPMKDDESLDFPEEINPMVAPQDFGR
ncbi:tetratricopeptide repeat protein [Aeoliella sp. SH292]|uniref:tetratricopeptide repeat protein n=1 Tax=Aeoliella sp. SH292 TaxID=3454464 RepID=UPI003F97D713